MKHAVLGAGAIGGLMSAALHYVGENVALIVRPEKLSGYPQTLTLHQPERTIMAEAHPVAKLTGSVDVLWIATKIYQLESALESITATPRVVVPLLNGTDHVALLRSRFGNERVIPATIAVGADRKAEGEFVQGSIVRLHVAASGESLLGDVLARLHERLGFICGFVANEQTLLWTKLCFLAPFALTTTASNKNKGGILSDAAWKATLESAIAEALAVARAYGAVIEDSTIWTIVNTSPDTMRSSMLKDLIAGRKLELDGIGGPIVRGGEKFGIATPTSRRLMAEISAKVGAN